MPDELRSLSRLAFDELGRAPDGVAQIHQAIATRAFGAVGVGGAPSRAMHDAIADSVYGALRCAAELAGRGAEGAIAGRAPGRPISSTPQGAAALGALNGLIGDVLEREGSDLQEPMALRAGGRIVAPDAFAHGTPRLVVFVHGLFETEYAWGRESYGDRLARDLGVTPLYVRYNSGRHVSENGASLAELLDAVVAAWPVEIQDITLVGHSMGGLVARSACHRGGDWTRHVRHVICLGTPHSGAPLEDALQMASAALAVLPETRPFAGFLRRRSAGIRDMRRGSLVDEDWRDRDPDALRAAACKEVPLLDGARHCFVSASVTAKPDHPLGRLIGDFLVLEPSATARAQERFHVGGAHHLALLNHPAVYERIRGWLAPPGG